MDFFRRSWAQIQVQLEKLPPSSKLLIASLVVILLLVGFLVLQYAATPELAPLMQVPPDRAPIVLARLQASNIKAESQGGQLLVPSDQRDAAYAILVQEDMMGNDVGAALDEMIKSQNPWMPNRQTDRAYINAKRKELGKIISNMEGVRVASVMLDVPERQGFGATHARPSASVTVTMDGSRRMNDRLAEAIAGLVAGSTPEMRPQDVTVIDNQGRKFTVRGPEDASAGDAMELVQALEQRYREKIERTLGYIPGVIVAVSVKTDPVLQRHVEETQYEPAEPLLSQEEREEERRSVHSAGEPGARPNAGADIAGSGGAGETERRTESRTTFGAKPVTRHVRAHELGQTAQQVGVTVNVPRSYFVSLYRQTQGDPAGEPDEAALRPIIDAQLAQIESQVATIIDSASAGVVKAHMVPDGGFNFGPPSPPPGIITTAMETNWVKPLGLALLGVASLALMFTMVRKATQQPHIPTVEDLAGVPPMLPPEEELVGEAEVIEGAIPGVELDEKQMRSRKIAEQIGELVKSNPSEAATLFNRWIRKED